MEKYKEKILDKENIYNLLINKNINGLKKILKNNNNYTSKEIENNKKYTNEEKTYYTASNLIQYLIYKRKG